ncbi:MAG: Gas vesicle structural protein 1 [Candidatus Bathyarchaeota archaeon BA2]|nr:MAG: Gas vesicle structural protein 1 [Candidatus Bathyarchaeota archaeon BA2]
MVTLRPEETGLKELLDRVLDKGVAVDTSVRVDLGSLDLLGAKAHIILASFKTAEKIGLDFPEGTNLNTPAWQNLKTTQLCPVCGMESRQEELKEEGCPWCGCYRPDER